MMSRRRDPGSTRISRMISTLFLFLMPVTGVVGVSVVPGRNLGEQIIAQIAVFFLTIKIVRHTFAGCRCANGGRADLHSAKKGLESGPRHSAVDANFEAAGTKAVLIYLRDKLRDHTRSGQKIPRQAARHFQVRVLVVHRVGNAQIERTGIIPLTGHFHGVIEFIHVPRSQGQRRSIGVMPYGSGGRAASSASASISFTSPKYTVFAIELWISTIASVKSLWSISWSCWISS